MAKAASSSNLPGENDFRGTRIQNQSQKLKIYPSNKIKGRSVGRARYFSSEDHGFDPRSGRRSLLVGVDVIIMLPSETYVMVSPLCLNVAAHKYVRYQSWDPLRDSLVADNRLKKH